MTQGDAPTSSPQGAPPGPPGASPGGDPSEPPSVDTAAIDAGAPASGGPGNKLGPRAKLAVEIGPLVVFFGTYVVAKRALGDEVDGVIWATGAFIVASLAALLTSWKVERRLQPTSVVTFVIVVIMGGLTIYLGDETFIKRKPTLVSGTLGAVLLGGLAVGRPLIKPLFGSTFPMDDAGWRKLTLRWGLFFLALAVLNEIVWRSMSTDAWVNYKTFGILPLSFLFVAAQLPLIQRHSTDPIAGPTAGSTAGSTNGPTPDGGSDPQGSDRS